MAFIITKMILGGSGLKRVKNSPEQGKLIQTSHQKRIRIRKGTWQQNSLRKIIIDSVELQVLLDFEDIFSEPDGSYSKCYIRRG